MSDVFCTVDVDPMLALLTIVPVGFWDVATVATFRNDFRRGVQTLNGRPYRILFDSRRFAVQSLEVRAALHQAILEQRALRTANLTSGSILQRLQSQRVPRRNGLFRNFGPDEEAAARFWLFEDVDDRPC